MSSFFIVLLRFIKSTFFREDDFNFKSKNFNPIRTILIILLTINFFFTLFLFSKINKLMLLIEKDCPALYEKIIKESHKSIKKAANGSFFTICSYFLFI